MDKSKDYECEFGCTGDVRFLSKENVTIYDEKGKEIKPKCNECGSMDASTCISGVNTTIWLCSECAYG